MELRDFVAQTITEISQGLIKAQDNSKNIGLIVAPHVSEKGSIALEGENEKPQTIHFDLMLSVSAVGSDETNGGSFHLKIAMVEIGASASSKDAKESSASMTQHVSFDVPILWPTTHKKEKPRGFDPIPSRHK